MANPYSFPGSQVAIDWSQNLIVEIVGTPDMGGCLVLTMGNIKYFALIDDLEPIGQVAKALLKC